MIRTYPARSRFPRLRGIRAYPLRLGRHRIEAARRVGTLRHLVVCRSGPDGVVEILDWSTTAWCFLGQPEGFSGQPTRVNGGKQA